VLVTETTGGAQDSEIKIFPPELPGFFIRPGGLAWDPSSNTLYYMERQSNMIVQMDMAGNTLRVFPRPVLLPNSFIGSEGLAVFWEPGAGLPPTLFITGVSSPAADRVNTIFEFDVNGQLTGHEIPLPSGSYLGITFVGHDLVALKSSTPGEFITLKAFSEEPGSPALFIRGDANGDVTVNLSDAIHLVAHLFQAGPPSPCEDAADANDDGKLNLSDAIYTIGYLFQGGQEPPPPFQRRGTDPTEDLLSCR